MSTLVGFFFVTASNPIDQLGVGVSVVMAIALLSLFARRLQRRSSSGEQSSQQIVSRMP